VDLHIAGAVGEARQEAGVVFALRLQAAGHGRDVVVLPDLRSGADGEAVASNGQAHWFAEGAEVGVERVALGAQHDQFTRLVRGNQD
jgi:hypothetical protein